MSTHLQLYDVGNQLWFGDGWVDYVVRVYVSVCVCVCMQVCMCERVILERIRFMKSELMHPFTCKEARPG